MMGNRRVDLLLSLTQSTNDYVAYQNAFDAVGAAVCIPVIGEASFSINTFLHSVDIYGQIYIFLSFALS